LEKIDSFIHAEVKKLYPGAKPPKFDVNRTSDKAMELLYQSPRCMGNVAEGLILGCAAYYGEKVTVKRGTLRDGSGSMEKFLLTQQIADTPKS
jgi:hypothetical protein